jgi:hypothetical protein
MKAKISIVLLFVICSNIRAEAQLVRSVGVKVGAAVAGQEWHYSTPDINFADQYRWGYSFGGYIEWLNISTFSVLTEVFYIQKGFKQGIERRDASGNPIGTFYLLPQIDYLSVPILIKIRYEMFSFAPYLLIGPRYDYLLRTKSDGLGIVLDNLKKSDFGITIGGGFEFSNISFLNIGAEYRYSPGLQYVYSNQYGLTIQNRSMEILLTIGY